MRLIAGAARVARWVVNLAFLLLLLGLALTMLAPRWWDLDFRAVVSGSMEPAMPVGAVVAIQAVDASEIQVGHVITFKSPENPDQVVTHRVVEITGPPDGRAYRTKGDANDDVDLELVPAGNVLGRARFRIPYVGYLARFVRTRAGWLYLIVVPAAVLIVIELFSILKSIWSSGEEPSKAAPAAKEPV